MPYRKVGRSGFVLPAISLGLWHNFGRLLHEDFAAYRDELIISTKAGWDIWPGPYGKGGGSRKHVLASLDQSLQRLGHRPCRHLLFAPVRPR